MLLVLVLTLPGIYGGLARELDYPNGASHNSDRQSMVTQWIIWNVCVCVCIKLIIDCYIVIAVCGHDDVEQQSNIEMQKHDRWPFCLFFFFRFLSLISNLSKIWFNKKNFYSSKEDKKKKNVQRDRTAASRTHRLTINYHRRSRLGRLEIVFFFFFGMKTKFKYKIKCVYKLTCCRSPESGCGRAVVPRILLCVTIHDREMSTIGRQILCRHTIHTKPFSRDKSTANIESMEMKWTVKWVNVNWTKRFTLNAMHVGVCVCDL